MEPPPLRLRLRYMRDKPSASVTMENRVRTLSEEKRLQNLTSGEGLPLGRTKLFSVSDIQELETNYCLYCLPKQDLHPSLQSLALPTDKFPA